MKIHEAIEKISKDKTEKLWARPVSWQGRGFAFCIREGKTHEVPSLRGGIHRMTTDPSELIGAWEVLESSKVIEESLKQ